MFPGVSEDAGMEYLDELWDVGNADIARRWILKKALSDERVRATGEDKCWLRDDEGEYEDALEYEPKYPHTYGLRSVVHSMLEDGAFVKPILDFLGDGLDLERQDPQGRTLFLSACRNPLGLDAAIDGVYHGLTRGRQGIYYNPYPQPNNAWSKFRVAA